MVANVMAFGATGKDGLADTIGIWLGAGIGSAYGIFYGGRFAWSTPARAPATARRDGGESLD